MKSLEAAREEGQQIEERARASKRSTAEPQSPEPKARRRPHTDDETENGSGGDGDDDSDDDPLAYLSKKVSAKAKNKAKAKSKAKANQGSPLKNARTSGVRRSIQKSKASAGGKGDTRKQQDLAVQNAALHTEVTTAMPIVLKQFPLGKVDKTLLSSLLSNCSSAITYYASPKHMDVTKLAALNSAKDKLDVMSKFEALKKKKIATPAEYEKCFQACAAQTIEVPEEYKTQHNKVIWAHAIQNADYTGALTTAESNNMDSTQLAELVRALVLRFVGQAKPQKEPRGKAMHDLSNFLLAFGPALLSACAEALGIRAQTG